MLQGYLNTFVLGLFQDAYVLCKIFEKSGLGPRIGEQYGAPFDENEWENLDAGTSFFTFAPSSVVEDPQAESSALATAIVIQEPPAPSQQSVLFSDEVNICSNEVNDAPPEIDGILLDELSMFLNDSSHHDISFAEVLACSFPSLLILEFLLKIFLANQLIFCCRIVVSLQYLNLRLKL